MKRILNLTAFFIVSMSAGLVFAFGVLCWIQANNFVNVYRFIAILDPADQGIRDYVDFEVVTDDGIPIRGWYIPPTRADGATFILLHGHASYINHMINEARWLTERGYGAVLFDFRGHGLSGDAPVTMGVHEVRDVQAVYDYTREQPAVNPERIALYGNSMGAATAILAADQMPDVWLVVAEAPYISIREALVDGIPQRTGLPALFFPEIIIGMSNVLSGADFGQADPGAVIGNLTQPIVLMHGTRDARIPYRHAEVLYERANDPRLLYIVEGAGHTDSFERDPAAFEATVLPFIEGHLTD